MTQEDQEKLRTAIQRIQQTMDENDELNDQVIATINEVNALLESIGSP